VIILSVFQSPEFFISSDVFVKKSYAVFIKSAPFSFYTVQSFDIVPIIAQQVIKFASAGASWGNPAVHF
jgi:hypothetical protein